MPKGGEQIAAIYGLRELRPSGELAARLALIIGPAEELFWRGLVQRLAVKLHGRWEGAALTAAAYGGAHAVTGNLTLVGAAGVAGAYWSALAAAGVPMAALIVSHIAWDLWIFLVAPTTGRTREEKP
jgi:membrane protease YdiL (CAAX protease family)